MDRKREKLLRWWQWRTIAVAMAGYALYYLVRKNLSTAMPSMEAQLGVTKTQLGLFLTVNGLIYGLSRFVNGLIADRVSARKFMALGLALCALVNLAFAFSDTLARAVGGAATGPAFLAVLTVVIGSWWLINGWTQGMGVPPVAPLMSHWIEPERLATKMSIWNMSHSVGAGLIFLLGAALVSIPGCSWRLFFLVPGALALAGAAGLFALLKDRPSDVGLPEVRTAGQEPDAAAPGGAAKSDGAYHRAFLRARVFANPLVWALSLANFFVYVVRFSMLDWGMMLIPRTKPGVSLATAAVMVAVFEFVGGNLGMVVWGWVTDRVFGGRGPRTCLVCMAGAAASVGLFYALPSGAPAWALFASFALIAFFIYGPQALLGIAAIKAATKEAAATAAGFTGVWGYLSTVFSGVGLGLVADRAGWDGVYAFVFVSALAAAGILVFCWNAAPDGYAAAAAFEAEWNKQEKRRET